MYAYGENPEELHAHRCEGCGWIWEHKGWNRADEKAHTCPNCGRLQFRRIGEPDPNQFINPYGS
jgi:rubredoxin